MTKASLRAAVLSLACLATPLTGRAATPTTQPSVDLSKDKTLYVVAYAHLDTQWRWAYPQTIREFVKATLDNNFPLIEKYPHYVFNFSGSRRYEFMKEYYPEQYAKLKEYVAQGRWFPCGSSVDENDANVPSAESIVRHVLYGNHFFRREFGTASDEYMLPDCFGFPYALPSVLAHCGIKGFSTQKLTWGSPIGIPFKVGTWEGPDGKSIIAALDPQAYVGKVTENLANSDMWTKRIEDTGEKSGVYTDYHYYGTGDRGGAPEEASVAEVEKSTTTNDGKIKVISGHADWMFKAITPEMAAKLPHYKGELELTQHSAGSISSEAYMKRWNRKNEQLADAAERASVAALWLGGAAYPSEKIYNAWDLLLGSQMHDMLPGTSIPQAYQFCWNDEVLASNQFAAVEGDAVGAVTRAMDTQGKGTSLVVYNPLSVPRIDVVEATVPLNSEYVRVFGPNGKPVPAQVISHDGDSATIAFVANVPSVGFASYDVRSANRQTKSKVLSVTDRTIENARYKVTLNDAGDIESVLDKAHNKQLLSAPARLAFMYENPAQYPAWNMDWDDQKKAPYAYVDGPAKISIAEDGPARVALKVEREAQGSKFEQTIRLSAGGDRVEFVNHIDWKTKESALKAVFPMAVSNELATYDIQVGNIQRHADSDKQYEFPQHQWIDLSSPSGDYGVSVLNDSKFGSDRPTDNTIRLTLLYTPGTRAGYQDQGTQDWGRHEMIYALAGHQEPLSTCETAWRAARLNQPLKAFVVPAHEGVLGKHFSLLKTNALNVMVTAIKKAEDSDEVVIRLREMSGTAAKDVHVQTAGNIVSAREVDGQEREIAPAKVEDGQLVTDVNGFTLKAFALKLAPSDNKVEPVSSQPVELAYNADVLSSSKNLKDGAFDKDGRTLDADQFPAQIISEGIAFKIGPKADGQNNAIACSGQTISLPSEGFDRLYILAAADGDAEGSFSVDGNPTILKIANWGGFVGQWDTRTWKGQVEELTYDWKNGISGLKPGFVRPDTLAWFSSHRHNPTSGNEFYEHAYLFKYVIPIQPGAKQLTLPNESRIKILAITAARGANNDVQPATPLRDMLKDHVQDAPVIAVSGGDHNDSQIVPVVMPLYWRDGGVHYTLDGSEPTAASPVYAQPISVSKNTTISARLITSEGEPGPVASEQVNVRDVTPPSVLSASGISITNQLKIVFSEMIEKKTAENPANYQGAQVQSVKLADDGRTVELALASSLSPGAKLMISNITDVSPARNVMPTKEVAVNLLAPSYRAETAELGQEVKVDGLPSHGKDPWTINFFIKSDKKPMNRTLFAGFGKVDDASEADGQSRYIALFGNGLHFWSRGRDVESKAKFKLKAWQMLTASYNGSTLKLYQDGKLIGQHDIQLSDDEGVVRIAPPDAWDHQAKFKGEIRELTIWPVALDDKAMETLKESLPK